AASFDNSHTPFFVMPLLLFNFILDTEFNKARRIIDAENPAEAHRIHIYQLLLRMGGSHGHVTLLYLALAVLQGGAALLIDRLIGLERLLLFLPFLLLYSVAASVVVWRARNLGLIRG
ncbi:MAG: hypothetical protein Q9M13_05360, partial [Mariprofundales bacterium]|nr:hypothetical protein [Mariprofundales bacterium]